MKIQFNTDKNVDGNEELNTFLTSLISKQLSRFESQITRLEVHLSDEDGKKEGFNNIRCMPEARLEGRAQLGSLPRPILRDVQLQGWVVS